MSTAEVTGIVGAIFAAIAAGATLVTVYFARQTVGYARETVDEARAAREDATRAHQQEMADREKARADDLVLQRHEQLGRVTDILSEIAEVAQSEAETPPRPIDPTQPTVWTTMPAMLKRLDAAITILEALGGPQIPRARDLVKRLDEGLVMPGQILGDAALALGQIANVAKTDESLALPER